MRLVSYIKGNQQILGKKNLGFQNIWGAKEFFCYQIFWGGGEFESEKFDVQKNYSGSKKSNEKKNWVRLLDLKDI